MLSTENLFDTATANEVKERIGRLRPDSARQWGKMNVAQAMAHCARGMEWALGDSVPPRMFIGRIIGGMVKGMVLKDDAPIRRNGPTSPTLIVREECHLTAEQERLCGLIDRLSRGGPASCTTHPHSFFGPLTPQEWSILMYNTSTTPASSGLTVTFSNLASRRNRRHDAVVSS